MSGQETLALSIKFNSIDNVAAGLSRLKIKPEQYNAVLADYYTESPYKSKMIAKGILRNSQDIGEKIGLLNMVKNVDNPGVRMQVIKAFKEGKQSMELITGLSVMPLDDCRLFFNDYFEAGGKITDVLDWIADITDGYSPDTNNKSLYSSRGFGDAFINFLVGIGKTVKDAITTVVDAVISGVHTLAEAMGYIVEYTQQRINGLINALLLAKKTVGEILNAVIEAIGAGIDTFRKVFKGILSAAKTVYDILSYLYAEAKEHLRDGIEALIDIESRIRDILAGALEFSTELLKAVIFYLKDLGHSVWYILNWARNSPDEVLGTVFSSLMEFGMDIMDIVAWCIRRSIDILIKGFRVLLALGYTFGVILVSLLTDPDNVYSKGLDALMKLGASLYELFEAAAGMGVGFIVRLFHALGELGINLSGIVKKAAELGFPPFKKILVWLMEADIEILEDLIFAAGFEYDHQQQIFYSRIDPWQQNFGYLSIYDDASPLCMIIIHSEPILFSYGGRNWKIEFWKGQYGICIGGEVGIYVGEFQPGTGWSVLDHTINHIEFEDASNCASGDDMLQMSFVLKKGDEIVFTRNSDNPGTAATEKHWWLTGFKPFEVAEPSELKMEICIVLKDVDMKKSFVGALEGAGYSKEKDLAYIDGDNIVNIVFDKPYTSQENWFNSDL